jgi:PAS domain S-box-containing protein
MLFEQMSAEMVKAMIETLPVEITVIDANDEVVGWNKHDTRLFHRPMTSMGLNFRECHPQESLHRVERIVTEMKSGQRDRARFWLDVPVPPDGGKKHKVLVEFYALRGPGGAYLGCVECTQDIEEIRHLAGERRLLD